MNHFRGILGFILAAAAFAATVVHAKDAAKPSAEAQLTEILAQVDADPTLAGINRDEALVEELRQAVLLPWENAWKAGDAVAFAASGPKWDGSSRVLSRERDGVREYRWNLSGKAGDGSESKKYLARFLKVEDFRLEALKLSPGEGRAELDVRFDLRGVTKKGARRHDRGELRLTVARVDGAWRLASVSPGTLESLEAEKPVFEEATAAWGLDAVPVTDRREAIRRGGYAIAAADYDGDGRPDLLVGGWGPVKLYRNTGKRFEDATVAAGLGGETLVKSAAMVDLDNDGHRDLLLLRFVEDGKDQDGDLVAYRNEGGGKFVRKANILTRTRNYDRTMPVTIADFDGNGTLDLYLGFPGNKDFTYMSPDPKPLATQGVWLNDGKWGFLEAPKASGIWDDQGLYPHSAIASDLNGDGRPDLVVMNDRAGLSPIYRNDGGGMFAEVSKRSGVDNHSWAMSAVAGDYDGDGFPDLMLTNIDFRAAHRIIAGRAGRSSGPKEDAALDRLRHNTVGNRLYRNKGDGTFEETTDRAGVRWAGEATAGAAWLDYSNSGRQDLYVMNGLWSGGRHDLSSLFVRLHANRQAAYADRVVDDALTSPFVMNEPASNSPLLEILRTVRGSPREPAKAEGPRPSLSMGGEQRNNLFRNNGDGTFTEVAYLLGADRQEDGYVAALADVDGDGRQDLILRNGDPAPGRDFGAVTLVLNKAPRERRSLTAFLEGSASNRDGIGARVTAWVGKTKLMREVQGPVGAAQGEPVAFFGLGAADTVDHLEVRWPSGLTEKFDGVPAGRVILREGKGYTPVLAAAQ